MLSFRKNKWLKAIAIALVLAFLPAQTSFARGRRGGNSSGDIILAALGGAAVPVSAYIFNANPYVMVITSAVRYGMIEAGADPQTTMLVTAGVGGVASGYFNPGANMADTMVKSVVKRIVAAEVTYELAQHEGTRPFAGLGGALAGHLTGAGIEKAYGNIEGYRGANGKYVAGYNDYMTAESFARMFISGGVSSLIRYELLPALFGDDSMALRLYGHELASLGGSLAVEGTEELGILPERTTYRVAQRIDSSYFVKEGGYEPTAKDKEVINQYDERSRDGLTWYDKEQSTLKIVRKEQGTWLVYHLRVCDEGEGVADDIKDMAERGYQFRMFRVDDKNEQLLALYKTVEPKEGETFTFKYNKVPFSKNVKNIQIGVDGIGRVSIPSEEKLLTPPVKVEPGLNLGGVNLSTENIEVDLSVEEAQSLVESLTGLPYR